jgi:hypothetical protein
MTPVNHWWEIVQQVAFAPISRIVAVFYLLSWDLMCKAEAEKEQQGEEKKMK